MPSKYCPKCGRITSTNGYPNFCAWGCGSLEDEPLLPPYNEWPAGGYYELCKIAQQDFEKRRKLKEPEPEPEVQPILKGEDIGRGRIQLSLF